MTMIFGESFQKALYPHRCDRCQWQIEPGEKYRRWVWKVSPRQVVIMREHLDCEPDDPLKDEKEIDLFEDLPLSLAA